MGAYVNFTNRIWIGEKNLEDGDLQRIGYFEIDDEFLRIIVDNPIINGPN